MKSLTEDEVKTLMRGDTYRNRNNPHHGEIVRKVTQAWENLYPDDDRNKKSTNYYIWKSVGDSKTRTSHAMRDGQVFCWDNPPEGGHLGEAFNCRCKAESYNPPNDKINEEGLVDTLKYASAGAMQGLSLGFSDEIEGAMGGLGYGIGSLNPKWNQSGESFTEAVKRGYVEKRDNRREHIKKGYEKSPAVMMTSELITALGSPGGLLFKVSKTAPLTIKARKNLVEAVATGGAYGVGVSEGGVDDYAKNIGLGALSSYAGNRVTQKAFGRGNANSSKNLLEQSIISGTNNLLGRAYNRYHSDKK